MSGIYQTAGSSSSVLDEGIWGSRRTQPCIPNFGTIYFMRWPLHARERAPGTHCTEGSVRCESSFTEGENLLTLAGNRTMTPRSLYQLRYTGL
jgi:hypothetical protein